MAAAKRSIYLGIDPGASGGIAEILEHGTIVCPMPQTEKDIYDRFRLFDGHEEIATIFALIERVNGFIGNGQPGSAMFKFGQNYGALRMALVGCGIPFEEVSPQTWQKAFALKRAKTESKVQWKNRLKAKAQQLFPGVTVTLATADALLIAEYGRRTRRTNR